MKTALRLTLITMMLILSNCANNKYSLEETKSESEKINAYFQEVFEMWVTRYPSFQTQLGRKTNYDKLDVHTLAFEQENDRLNDLALEKIKTFKYEALDKQSKISYRLFKKNLEDNIVSRKWRYHGFPINQMFGYHTSFVAFMINFHTISDEQQAKDYISRLKEVRRAFSERLANMKIRESKGIFPPAFVFPKAQDAITNIVSGRPFNKSKDDSPLFRDFKVKVGKLKISKTKKLALIQSSKSALLNSVQPAYKELSHYLKKLEKKSTRIAGVWSLPDGANFYNNRLKNITTTNLTASEIHALGLSEVERIQKEIHGIMAKIGFKGNLSEFFNYVKTDKKFFFPSGGRGRIAYLKQVNKTVNEITSALPLMFNTLPKSKLKVKPVEAFREKTAGLAFYQQPAMDGSRPGIYYVNLYDMNDHPTYSVDALAYHEAIPGHHMQNSISQELTELPMFRRTAHYTAYGEGWGLYSEFLPKEYGFYKDPYSDYGRLQMELWRACRLVVDTGIHFKKWSREKAINYLKDNTSNTELEIVKGIERYFIMPGQATAYKVGMLKILELRKKSKKELGRKFNIGAFHDVILTNGPLPLSELEVQVNNWIEDVQTKKAL